MRATSGTTQPPPVYRRSGEELLERFAAISALCGGDDAARDAVRREPRLLTCELHLLTTRYLVPDDGAGSDEDAAMHVVASQLGLLRSRALTLRASHAAIVAALGPVRAPQVLANTPALLQIRAHVLAYNWTHYVAYLGQKRAAALAAAVPHVLAARIVRPLRRTRIALFVFRFLNSG